MNKALREAEELAKVLNCYPCKQCKYFSRSWVGIEFSKCSQPNVMEWQRTWDRNSVITGNSKVYCSQARDGGPCEGRIGEFFEFKTTLVGLIVSLFRKVFNK